MDKRVVDQIVEIYKDTTLHHKTVLNWHSDGKVHVTDDFFIEQFLTDKNLKIDFEWYNEHRTQLEVSCVYKGVGFFALIDAASVLQGLVFVKPYVD